VYEREREIGNVKNVGRLRKNEVEICNETEREKNNEVEMKRERRLYHGRER
jgi:hypothetical protein